MVSESYMFIFHIGSVQWSLPTLISNPYKNDQIIHSTVWRQSYLYFLRKVFINFPMVPVVIKLNLKPLSSFQNGKTLRLRQSNSIIG
jgi:hypothetical protein